MAEFLLGCKGEKNLPKKSFSVFYISLGTFNRFYKVLVSSYLIGIMLKMNVQILRTSGGSFQDGVLTCSVAWSAYSCFVNKLRISLLFTIKILFSL